ncbi:MAG: hypothetical protein ACM3L6_00225 [Deltaproteobacteria bacterium]
MKEPVLFWPVRLEGTTLHILDETRVPEEIVYLKVRDYRQAVEAVVKMKTRAFGQFLTVVSSFLLEARKAKAASPEVMLLLFEKIAQAFNASRPTFPFEEVTGMVLGVARGLGGGPDFRSALLASLEGILEGVRRQRYGRAEAAARLLSDGERILTHCHVSGEMALIGAICRREKKRVAFYATETRPYFQGARLTAWELKDAGCDVTLIPDNAVAATMKQKKITCVLVGSDRSARNGDFANKIGTYQIALLAKHFNIPFYALVQPSQQCATGADLPVEVRSDDEILAFEGHRFGDKRLQAYYPAFDVVPARLVTRHIAIDPSGRGSREKGGEAGAHARG